MLTFETTKKFINSHAISGYGDAMAENLICKDFVVEKTREVYELCGYEDSQGRFVVRTETKKGKL